MTISMKVKSYPKPARSIITLTRGWTKSACC